MRKVNEFELELSQPSEKKKKKPLFKLSKNTSLSRYSQKVPVA